MSRTPAARIRATGTMIGRRKAFIGGRLGTITPWS
jgi:hypothetical protein